MVDPRIEKIGELVKESERLIERLQIILNGTSQMHHMGALANLFTKTIVADVMRRPPDDRSDSIVRALDLFAAQVIDTWRSEDPNNDSTVNEIHDISGQPEEQVIQTIAAGVRHHTGSAAFVVESDEKADRFMAKLAPFGIREVTRDVAPDDCIVVTIAPRGN